VKVYELKQSFRLVSGTSEYAQFVGPLPVLKTWYLPVVTSSCTATDLQETRLVVGEQEIKFLPLDRW
jgi:hypothetical protein